MAELPHTEAVLCENAASFLSSSFDYLIVGGGTAGLVLATRLTEDPNIQVGVIEAGKLRLGDWNIESMAGMSAMFNNPDYDWAFKSVPQLNNNGRIHHVARGKVVGGSSAINFMAYVRPVAADIESWNIEGWSWSDLEPYYHKSETNYQKNRDDWPDSHASWPEHHGTMGPIHTSFPVWKAPVEDAFMKAFSDNTDLPYPPPADPWGGVHLGFFQSLNTIDRSQAGKVTRSYAATGYLAPVMGRQNLKILTEATVSRILIEKGKRLSHEDQAVSASGVVFEHRGCTSSVSAKREVILCCSSIQSPRLLELSGIGNPEVLTAAGIDCVVNLPLVGENLQEHPMTAVTYELTPEADNNNISIDSIFLDATLLAEHQRLFAENQTGMLGSGHGFMGFVPYATQVDDERLRKTVSSIASSSYLQDEFQQAQGKFIADQLRDPTAAAIQLIGMPFSSDIISGATDLSKFASGPQPGRNAGYTFLISTMYPVSRGSSHISSSADSIWSSPRIDLGLISHPADIDVLSAGLSFVDRVLSPSSPDQSTHVKGKIVERVDPAPKIDIQDLSQAKDCVQDRIMIFNHILGTCAMGQVVDAKLRVKGVAGLRVVDASVIPAQISGNIVATVYAMAEKAADLIKDDYHMATQ